MSKWKLNPTLKILESADFNHVLPLKSRIGIFTKYHGPRSIVIPTLLASSLTKIQPGESLEKVFDKDLISFLSQCEIILEEEIHPEIQYECKLIPEFSNHAIFDFTIDSYFSVENDPLKGMQLLKKSPMLGTLAQYEITKDTFDAFILLSCSVKGEIPRNVTGALTKSGCFTTERTIAERKQKEIDNFENNQNEYCQSRFTIINEVVSKLELECIQKYCKQVKNRGFLDGDFISGGKQRSHIYNDPQLAWLHLRSADLVSAIVRKKMEPSYSFLAFYNEGGDLPLHRDKPNCQVSISLAIDSSSNCVLNQWPLLIQHSNQPIKEIFWSIGEGLLFEGVNIAHKRLALPKNQSATFLILHYFGS